MTRTLTDDDLALAQGLFALFPLFGRIAHEAALECELGSSERARLLFGLRTGPVRAGQLAHGAKLSPPAVTELVEHLEREGLVRREADALDRRAVRIALTADGRRQMQRFEHAAAAALAESLASLSAAQRQRVRIAFADLRDAIASKEPTNVR